jgi:DNA-binding transcriptional MocR family regulator
VHHRRRDRSDHARAARRRETRRCDRGRVPAYFGVLQAIESLGLRALEIPAHPRTGFDVGAFEEAIRAQPVRAVFVTPTVSNPLGAVMPEDERERLGQDHASHDIPIIEDDVYGELLFDGSRPRPMRSFAGPSEDSHVVLVSSVSKTLAPAIRVGWVAGGPLARSDRSPQVQPVARVPAAARHGDRRVLSSGGYDRHLRRSVPRLPATSSATAKRSRSIPEGTRVSSPRAASCCGSSYHLGVDALSLHEQALAARNRRRAGPTFLRAPEVREFHTHQRGLAMERSDRDAMRTLGRLVGKS